MDSKIILHDCSCFNLDLELTRVIFQTMESNRADHYLYYHNISCCCVDIEESFKSTCKYTILVGVGSSICGGSAIAATAPIIDADDDEIAQAIAVIFFFNVLAAIFFPILGKAIGFDTVHGEHLVFLQEQQSMTHHL